MCDHTMGCDECGEQTCKKCLEDCKVCLEEFCSNCITIINEAEGEEWKDGHVCFGELEEGG